MLLFLIRHPRPDVPPGICYGQSDVAVTAAAIAEAVERTLPLLPAVIDYWWSSPLRRCTEYAQALQRQRRATGLVDGKGLLLDPRLQELDFGDFELRPWAELHQPRYESWWQDYVGQPAPGGESYLQLADRVEDWLAEITSPAPEPGRTTPTPGHAETANPYDGGTWAVVCHAGVIRAALSRLLGLPLANSFRIKLDFGTVVQLRLESDAPAGLISLGSAAGGAKAD